MRALRTRGTFYAESEEGPCAGGCLLVLSCAHCVPIPGSAALPSSPGSIWVQILFSVDPRGQVCASPNTHRPHHVLRQPLLLGPVHPFGQTAVRLLVILDCTQSVPRGTRSEAPALQGHSPSGPRVHRGRGRLPWPLAVNPVTGHARLLLVEGTVLGGVGQVSGGRFWPLISSPWPEPLGPSTHPDALSNRPPPSLVGPVGHSHLPTSCGTWLSTGGVKRGLSVRRLLDSRPLGPEQALSYAHSD